jgi:ABC-2 type transport system permease protein
MADYARLSMFMCCGINGTSIPSVSLTIDMRAFDIALKDFDESLKLYPLWMYQGRAEVLRRYQRTVLGPLWHTLSLAIFIGVTGVIWAAIMKVDLARYMTFLPAGLVTWGMISSFVLDGAGMLTAAQSQILSSRTPFPMLAMSLVWRIFLIFLHQLPLCLLAILVFGGAWNWNTLQLLPGIAVACASGIWMSLLSGMLTLRFRDAQSVIGSAMHIAMFATPIFWSRDLLGPDLGYLADWNPLFHLVEIMRQPILGQSPTVANWLVSLSWMAGGLALTLFIYGRVRHRIAYWF